MLKFTNYGQEVSHRYDDSIARAHPEAVVGHQERGDPNEAEPELPSAYKCGQIILLEDTL